MRTELRIKTGEYIPVHLRFPDLNEDIEIVGRIAWRNKWGEFGLEYQGMDPDDLLLLGILISHQEVLTQRVYVP
jgi:hypothetical protein